MAERKFPIDFNERTAVKTTDVLLINNIDNGEDEFAIVENVGKALDAANSTINGVKTYAVSPIIPNADADNKPASKGQMDSADALKADKVTGAVSGNFAGLDVNGNLTDSGKKAADFEPADETILKEVDIANNLAETVAGKVLDATQGKLLNDGLALKSDKVTGATSGNLAGLDVNGNLTDSGKKATDFEPADETILKEADIANNLSETVAGKLLDATQGKLLNDELALKVDKNSVKQTTGDSTTDLMSQKAVTDELALKVDKTSVKQVTGESLVDVMSQKAVTDELALKADQTELERLEQESIDRTFKTMRIGASGLTTLSPTTQYFTYRLNVIDNIVLNIDLQRMIEQVGNARCRLIIDMPVKKTITITNPFLWGGTASTFDTAGQYVLEVIDVDGSGTPLIWLVASTTKVQSTGNILFVDSSGANYTVSEINEEVATRATSSWANPFKYLQNAINAASAGDIIFVKAGVHKPTHLRTTPTSYTDGDCLNRNATFTPKNGVDIYGGFLGSETKTWQRVVDENGLPVNKTIFSGDILDEATIDPAKTVGDRRTDASKANAAYNVVYASVASYTYFNGVEVKYGFANGAAAPINIGSGVSSANTNLVVSFCTITGNTATTGGGTNSGTVTNCSITGNTATNGGGTNNSTVTNCTITGNKATNGGGTNSGTVTNCSITGNTATTGGGTNSGTVTNCSITGNTATNGGGTNNSTVTNCTITGNTATNGGGTNNSTVTNCTITGNTATNGGGTNNSTVTNCTITGNTATNGGGTNSGTVTNCTITGNKGAQAVYGSATADVNYNNLVFGNKTAAGVTVAYDNKTATGIKIFRNNAYDTAHPTITGGAGSDIDTTTCIQNLTLAQAGIMALSFAGVPATPEQWEELNAYISEAKARPTGVNLLKGAGINSATYPAPATDITNIERPSIGNNVTIGAYESE